MSARLLIPSRVLLYPALLALLLLAAALPLVRLIGWPLRFEHKVARASGGALTFSTYPGGGPMPVPAAPIVTDTTPTDTPINTPTATSTITPTPLPGCSISWSVVQHPNSGVLAGVAAISPDDVWVSGPGAVLHWDGDQWSYNSPPASVGTPSKISAASSSNVWVLGSAGAAEWNGAAWAAHPIPTPYPGFGTYQYYGISAYAADNVWVVGNNDELGDYNPAVLFHWNGTTWGGSTIAPARAPDGGILEEDYLYDVWTFGPHGMWAVGYSSCIGCNQPSGPIVVSCTAAGCVAPGPVMPNTTAVLYGVIGFSTADAWAVGTYNNKSLILRYDGSSWQTWPHPQVGDLHDIGGSGPDDLWAVGSSAILHWDGQAWTQVASLSGAADVSADNPANAWAAGINVLHTTSTPVFNDVPLSDPFYSYVQALYCRSVISGYSCGGPGEPCPGLYFRPGNNTTRGQLSKIVVNAEGWALNTTGGPHFTDVPPTHPFYAYIETAFNHSIISGYSCGANCLEFRPGNNITRAQLTKVVVLARNWAITPTSQPTFRDVPVGDPFYGYVETAYAHRVISGYSCGANCLEFRPGNNATRGQISKIVYNAVTAP